MVKERDKAAESGSIKPFIDISVIILTVPTTKDPQSIKSCIYLKNIWYAIEALILSAAVYLPSYTNF